VCTVFMQKYNQRKAAKDHVRQKLQEHTGLTPHSVRSLQPVDDSDGQITKLKKCCVSFKPSSPGSCSCGLVSAKSTNMYDAGSVISEKNRGLVADVSVEHNSDLLESVNSENLLPESHSDLITSVAELSKPECYQPNSSRGVSEQNGVHLEHLLQYHAAVLINVQICTLEVCQCRTKR